MSPAGYWMIPSRDWAFCQGSNTSWGNQSLGRAPQTCSVLGWYSCRFIWQGGDWETKVVICFFVISYLCLQAEGLPELHLLTLATRAGYPGCTVRRWSWLRMWEAIRQTGPYKLPGKPSELPVRKLHFNTLLHPPKNKTLRLLRGSSSTFHQLLNK